MKKNKVKIRNALISVSNKKGSWKICKKSWFIRCKNYS